MEKRELDAINAATSAGGREAIANPATWEHGIVAMREALSNAAQKESGKWVVGWFVWMLKKAALGIAIVAVLYYTGGLPAVLAWLKAK